MQSRDTESGLDPEMVPYSKSGRPAFPFRANRAVRAQAASSGTGGRASSTGAAQASAMSSISRALVE